MTIIKLFINFINEILSINILGMNLYMWLITITILIFTYRLIYEITGTRTKNNKKDKGDKKE